MTDPTRSRGPVVLERSIERVNRSTAPTMSKAEFLSSTEYSIE